MQFVFTLEQGRNHGGTIPREPNHYGGAKKSQKCHKYFINTVHLPPTNWLKKTNWLMNIVIDYPMRYYETTLRLGLYTWNYPISACL